METVVGSSGLLSRLRAYIDSRYGTIVLAVFLIADSAAVIGIIIRDGSLGRNYYSDHDHYYPEFYYDKSAGEDLKDLTIQSLIAAICVLVLGGGVLIAEVIAAILARTKVESRKCAILYFDIVFSAVAALCYGATGIACAVFAAMWRKSDLCHFRYNSDFKCDSVRLTASNAILAAAVLSFTQAAAFGYIIFKVIYTTVKTMKTYV